MIIAITASAEGIDSPVDPRFGRAAYFAIVDTENDQCNSIPNEAVSAAAGAGVTAAKTITDTGAQAVLTGNCGPNAARTLQAAGIKIYAGVSGTVKEAIEAFKAGKLNETQGPTVESHFGTNG
ncbi:MAG: NifB/NifX family molybdenum-iron cluster-binding protein [Sedimentisphaerales bacterium]|nr:NifB/NifX family molybdenum-iron cluster-binding protein [Sedimentisphaerales bacterium]